MPSAHTPLADVWRADRIDPRAPEGRSTGFPALDAELPDGGWPSAGLVDILGAYQAGIEWLVLAPWLQTAAADAGPVLCLAPPRHPYAPGFHQAGLPIDRLLLVRTACAADTAWAAEQALQVASCQALIWWVGANFYQMSNTMLRRVHLAAMTRKTPVFAIGPTKAGLRSSPAPTRLMFQRHQSKLAITVFKRRGPPMSCPIEVEIPIFNGDTWRRWQALTQKKIPTKAHEAPRHVLARALSAGLAA